jgi:ribosome maturation factor RimP
MGRAIASVDRELDARIGELGFELVESEWAGSKARPILRIRVDRAGAEVGEGITVDECAQVSRGLEPWLDEHPDVPERYVLEVSSPGVNRPLVRPRDWERFAGQDVVVKARRPLVGESKRFEGRLLGVQKGEGEDASLTIRVELESGEEVQFGPEDVDRATLLYRWD